jgi:Lon protease-like protein
LSEAHEPDARGPEPAPIPSGWPPADGDAACKVVPLFPLPNLFLFPGTVMPLHVFEPRYRQMVEDMLDGPGRLVIGTVLEDHTDQLDGAPPVHEVAGLGEIGRHEKLPDGRFLIWVFGLRRVAVREVDSDRPYRRVAFSVLDEVEVPAEYACSLKERLRKAILERCAPSASERPGREEPLQLPDDMPIGTLVDVLLQRMQLPQSVMQQLYSELVVAQRAEDALSEHARRR